MLFRYVHVSKFPAIHKYDGRNHNRCLASAILTSVVLLSSTVRADLTVTGNVIPTEPNTWSSSTTSNIGNTADGTLTVNGSSTLLSYNSYLGNSSGTSGLVTIDGTGAKFYVSNNLYVGNASKGEIDIINGGFQSNGYFSYVGYAQNSVGTLHIDGTNSTYKPGLDCYIGYSGSGNLKVTNGGTVNYSGGDFYFGYNSYSLGTGLVDGLGSKLNTDWCYVGNYGNGSLNITNSGTVNSYKIYLGNTNDSIGTAIVDGPGSKWTATSTDGSVLIGVNGSGALLIKNGGALSSNDDQLGVRSGSSGIVTVDGVGSTWSSGTIRVGVSGTGILNITNSAKVNVNYITYLSYNNGSSGTINFGSNGGVLTTRSLLFKSSSQFIGTGTINTLGMVSDSNLVVDANHGPSQTIAWNSTGQNINVNLDLSGTKGLGLLGAGYLGTGSLTIRDGLTANSSMGYLGYQASGNGTALVTGSGSTWNGSIIDIGLFGKGILNITNGGKVISSSIELGINYLSNGVVNIDGKNSQIINSSCIYLGSGSTATMNISNGGAVTTSGTLVGTSGNGVGTINIDGTDSTFTNSNGLNIGDSGIGKLYITNGGKVSDSSGLLGVSKGASGTVSVDGAGSSWSNSTNCYIGKYGTGSLKITNGGTVNNTCTSYVPFDSTGSGSVIVDGSGSIWNISKDFYVRGSTAGTIQITNVGQVNVLGTTYLQPNAVNFSSINFGSTGGVLNTGGLYFNTSQLMGTGTIYAQGVVTDLDLIFDATHPASQTIKLQSTSQNVTLNLDLSGTNGVKDLGVGYMGTGSLSLRAGTVVKSSQGYLGYLTQSKGSATIDGNGSTWSGTNALYVGYSGEGNLIVTNGGSVNNFYSCTLGYNTNSSGSVIVDGVGSNISISESFMVGRNGTGKLAITNHATVNDQYGSIGYYNSYGTALVDGSGSKWVNSSSFTLTSGKLYISNGGLVTASGGGVGYSCLASILVDNGSSLNFAGYFTNSGTVRLSAGSQAAPGSTWTPIKANSWTPTNGKVQTLGGIWNSTNHTFTASSISDGSPGSPTTIDRSIVQRIHITDSALPTNDLYAAFTPTASSSNLGMTASLFSDTQKAILISNLSSTDSLLSAWNFTATGYTTGDPVLLSFNIGSDFSADKLALWHFDGTTWTPYTADDLNYNGTYANFTVTDLSGYAVTTTIPEPASLLLLATGTLTLLSRRKKF